MAGDAPNPQPPEVKELIKLLNEASARAIEIIKNPPGKSDRSKSFNSSHAAAQLAQYERHLKALEATAVQIADKTVRRAYDQGVKDAEKMARDIGVADGPLKGGFSQVETRRAKVLVRDTADDIGNGIRSMGKTTRTIVRKIQAEGLTDTDINRLMAGETLQGHAPKVLREIRELCKKAAIDVDGKSKLMTVNTRTGLVQYHNPESYADLVFQTKLAEATNIATLERLRERKIGYIRIIGSNSTNFCTVFVGKVYYIGLGKDPEGTYPNITELPRGGAPFHPRCTKRYVAFVPGLATQKQKDEGKPTPETLDLHEKSPAEAQRKFEESKENSVTKAKVPGNDSDNVQKAKLSPRRSGEPEETPPPKPLALRGDADTPGPHDVDISDVRIVTSYPAHRLMAESAVRRARAKGYDIPKTIRDGPDHFKPEDNDLYPAGYLGETEEILINTSYRHWPRFNQLLQYRASTGDISTDDPDYVILHEIAHHMVVKNLGYNRYRSMGADLLLDAEVRIAESVSLYAKSDPLEFVAEVFALIMSGQTPSPAVLKVYRKYGVS